MQRVSPLARGIDKAMLCALAYIAAFIWMYTRVRSLAWAALLALPLTLLAALSVYMLSTRLPSLKRNRTEAEGKEHALFLLLTGDAGAALETIAAGVYAAFGHKMERIVGGVAYAVDGERTLALGVVHGAADTRALLDFHKRAHKAQRALLCSLETPEAGAVALAHRLASPSVLLYGPAEITPFIKGVTPSGEEREHIARAKKAQGAWAAFRSLALRKERAARYMLYALALMTVYILTGWVWYPMPALACAVLGAASAGRGKTPKSPF